MTEHQPADQAQRDAALRLDSSFIVQAPAGSGKTELLAQRMLKLLGRVERPERVLAITFTRKATQEMRTRILKRLRQADSDAAIEEHERTAVELARGVLENGRQRGWDLLENPARLRILTIDGLCTQLLQRSTRHGAAVGGLRILDDAGRLYRKAARALIEDLGEPPGDGSDPAIGQAHPLLIRVLKHLDGDNLRLEELLTGMLAIRDQWVPLIGRARETMHEVLESRQQIDMEDWRSALGEEPLTRAEQLLCVIGKNLSDAEHAASRFAALPTTPQSAEEAVWRAYWFCQAFRTDSGGLRGRTAIKPGIFPGLNPDLGDTVQQLSAIYQDWHQGQNSQKALDWMAKSPPLEESAGGGSVLDDVLGLLNILRAELQVVIDETGEADFTHVAQAALAALEPVEGEEVSPVLLMEDMRLEHLLVDEFQDTSHTQHKLLRLLTEGWVPDDGRTLFLVGDPMQSIYRFREADVGLFTAVVEQRRLGGVSVQPLALTANFRSRREVVDWVNAWFPHIFPAHAQMDSGAVAYRPATAERGEGGAVQVHMQHPDSGPMEEARCVAGLVREHLAADEDSVIALLVRSRSHLRHIVQELLHEGIPFDAVEIDPLQDRPVVQDLLAITRVLEQSADRIAWLGLLRAPWCGLTLADLHHVAGEDRHAEPLQLLENVLNKGLLQPAMAERVTRLHRVMHLALSLNPSLRLSERVEAAWLQLGGPHCVSGPEELENADMLLDLLRRLEQQSPVELVPRIQEALGRLYARGRHARVQLMTIHKAKGLEFDVVILPGLGKKTGSGRSRLVLAQQFSLNTDDGAAGGTGRDGGVLMAPIRAKGQSGPSLSDYLRRIDTERERFETTRVLYVAVTRARRHLHLVGQMTQSQIDGGNPPSGSFLELLFPACEHALADLTANAKTQGIGVQATNVPSVLPLLRLRAFPDFAFSEPEPAEAVQAGCLPARDNAALGHALHQWLELLHDHWDDFQAQGRGGDWFEGHPAMLESLLRRSGASRAKLPGLLTQLSGMIAAILNAEPGSSVLSPDNKSQSFAELPLLEARGHFIKHHIIDRLYQCADGTWTIVDYKTGADREDTRDLWQSQLQRYRGLVNGLGLGAVAGTLIYQANDNTIIDLSKETGLPG